MKKIIIGLVVLIITLIILLISVYLYNIQPVSKDTNLITVTIPSKTSVSGIAKILKNNKIIRNETAFKVYLKLNKITNLQAATYQFSQNMNVSKVVSILKNGENIDLESITITFKEGKNMRYIADVISSNTNNSYDSVFELMKDESYINELIEKYWFLTDVIKNKNIYYPLEGYLYPNTYKFKNKDVTVKEIFTKMLDEMSLVLNKYKDKLSDNKYSIHELISLASVIELEGVDVESRNMIAGVFYNRLKNNWSLGSDVTTYYANKIDISSDRDLYKSELDLQNPYNTRAVGMEGKLPIGPISSVSKSSIDAVINPVSNDYFFFVADKNTKVYYAKTYEEHNKIIQQLKDEGLWIF